MKKTTYAVLIILFSLNLLQVSAQTDKKAIEKLVTSKNFVFNATRANPMAEISLNQIMGPNSVNNILDLSNERYQLQVTKDTVTASLPYFGRAFNAPMNPTDMGINFISKDFTYSATKKKRNWIITIEPKDIPNGQKLILNVSDSGYATLSVIDYNRQTISFDGYISEIQTADKS